MSSLLLAVAMVGTFFTVFLVGVFIDMRARERNRPVAILESQVGAVAEPVDLRQQALQGSFMDRALIPAAKRFGGAVVRLTPFDLHTRINRKLVLAGSPAGWDAERVVAMKIIGGIGCFVLGVFLAGMLPAPTALKIVLVTILTLIGYTIPGAQVGSMAAKRQKTIQRQLPDVMDLLTISVEAGLGFDAALAQVVHNVPGPLAEELTRLLQEVQIGVSRVDAFRNLANRTEVPELRAFVLSMIQADLFGVSIANVLRSQARELRLKRRQRAEEIAQKIPVKLLLPMIFLVLPAMFIVLLGPGAMKVMETFF